MDGDREKSIMAGCDDYLTKPIHPPSLLAKISQFIPSGTSSAKKDPESSQEQKNTSADKKK
jgi:DNA-binding response OmpR family regulator